MFLSLKLAIRFLFSYKLGSFSSYASWLAIGGLSIGVTALMLTASIIEGFQDVISEKLSSFEGHARILHILGKPINISNEPINSLLKDSNNLPDEFIRGVCMLRSGAFAEGVLIEGVNFLPRSISMNQHKQIESNTIVLGNGLALSLNVKKGDTLFIQSFPKENLYLNTPRIKALRISKIFSSGLQEFDKTLAYTSLEDARWLFSLNSNEVSGLIVNNEFLSQYEKRINYPYHLETWKERHSLLFEWINLQRWPAYLMFGLIALVGLVNLIASIAMIIIEKSSQIGILLSQGIRKDSLVRIFMLQGVFIGLVGGLLGGLLSTIIIFIQLRYRLFEIPSDIYFMDNVPFSFNIFIFLIILGLVLLFSILASWVPVKNLSKFNIVAALRYE